MLQLILGELFNTLALYSSKHFWREMMFFYLIQFFHTFCFILLPILPLSAHYPSHFVSAP